MLTFHLAIDLKMNADQQPTARTSHVWVREQDVAVSCDVKAAATEMKLKFAGR